MVNRKNNRKRQSPHRKNYRPKFKFFNYRFSDFEVIENFEKFWDKDLKEFLTYAEGKSIQVGYDQAKAIGEGRGKQQALFKALADTIEMEASNNSKYKNLHQQNIFYEIFKTSTTLLHVYNQTKKYLNLLNKEGYQWNVVWYAEYLPGAINKK